MLIPFSMDNLIEGFDCALRTDWNFDFEAFNLVDADIDKKIVDMQECIKKEWPNVPNYTKGNAMPFSTEKISSMLGYKSIANGRYISEKIANMAHPWYISKVINTK